jgi:signal peptidase I
MTLRISTILATVAIIVVAALGWFFFAPSQLGGSTSYVITKGISMEPLLRSGDLVLLRKQSSYRLQEIVGYRDPQLRHIVMHRIVAIKGDRLTTKGDNNNFVDPYHPSVSEVIGAKWVMLPHGGSVLLWIQHPENAAFLAIGALIIAAAGTTTTKRRRKRPKGGGPAAVPPRTPRHLGLAWIAPAVLLVLSGALAIASMTRSSHVSTTTPNLYRQTGDFSYIGNAKPSVVYPDGTVKTGQTAFTSLVKTLRFTFDYRLQSLAPAVVSGHATMIMRLFSADTGYSRVFQLTPRRAFSGGSVSLTGVISLTRLASTISQISTKSTVTTSNYELTVLPTVQVKGTVAGQQVNDALTAQLPFAFTGPMLSIDRQAAQSQTATATGQAPISLTHVTKSGAGTLTSSRSIDLRFVKMSVGTARAISVAGILLALAGFGLAIAVGVRHRQANEPELIQRLYSHLLLPIATLPDLKRVVEVDDMDALANVADRYERPILHYENGAAHTYLLQDEGLFYRYVAGNGYAPAAHLASERPPAAAPPASVSEAPDYPPGADVPPEVQPQDFQPPYPPGA